MSTTAHLTPPALSFGATQLALGGISASTLRRLDDELRPARDLYGHRIYDVESVQALAYARAARGVGGAR